MKDFKTESGILHSLTYDPQTTTAMTWFVLAMIAYSEKLKKCQEELDRAVGPAHMSTSEDHHSYISATVRELWWRPVAPLGEACPKFQPFVRGSDQCP